MDIFFLTEGSQHIPSSNAISGCTLGLQTFPLLYLQLQKTCIKQIKKKIVPLFRNCISSFRRILWFQLLLFKIFCNCSIHNFCLNQAELNFDCMKYSSRSVQRSGCPFLDCRFSIICSSAFTLIETDVDNETNKLAKVPNGIGVSMQYEHLHTILYNSIQVIFICLGIGLGLLVWTLP